MISIKKAGPEHAVLLSELAAQTFLESHGNSASPEDIAAYVAAHYTPEILKTELGSRSGRVTVIYDNPPAATYCRGNFSQ